MRPLVIVPTYNERDNLPVVVAALLRIPHVEVLVVDDGSPDGTGDVADALGLQKRLPAVCSALGTNTFEDECRVKRTACEGPLNGANLRLTFRILD